jgi:ATP-dependent Clp protease, protease subunit
MITDYRIDLIGNSLYFTGHINQSSAHEFIVKLQELENSIQGREDKEVKLYLSSEGEDVPSGFRMYESLKFFKGKITCYPEGHVASSAVTVVCGGSKVIFSPLTTFLIHQLSGYLDGSYETTKSILGWYDVLQNNMADIYNKKTNGKVTAEMLKEEVYLTAQQALDLGLVDEILNYN